MALVVSSRAVSSAKVRYRLHDNSRSGRLCVDVDRYDLAALGENSGLWDWNLTSGRIHFSPRWISMLGYERHEIGTKPEEWFQRIHPDDLEQMQRSIDHELAGSSCQFALQHRLRHSDGTYRWMSCCGVIERAENGQAMRISGSHSDITAEKVVDALTGLPNRLLLMDRLARSVARSRQRGDHIFALLMLDLDRPETLAGRLGSSAGDQLLVAAARRLETGLRAGDTLARLGRDHVVARLGGDVFAVLLDGLNEVGEAKCVAERLLKEVSTPFEIDGHDIFLTASCGIALSATGYGSAEEVVRDADTALYRAKSLGKSRCEVFDTAVLELSNARRQLEDDMQAALDRQEFTLLYQPILSLASGEIAGFEALVRWQHPVRGMISPQEFIPIAEKTGLILPLGRWILREACRQLKAWQNDLNIPQTLWISVNLSSVQFVRPSLVDCVCEVLQEFRLAPNCLMLELTEGLLIGNPEAASSLLMELRVMGVQTGLDDFGTGYSSLTYLRQFPLDFLKIDRSFVKGIRAGGDAFEIVGTISGLAEQLGLRMIAEGIENSAQLDSVRSLHCEFGQGFLFSKPVDSEGAEALLKEDRPRRQEAIVKMERPAESMAMTGPFPDVHVLPCDASVQIESLPIRRKAARFTRNEGLLLVALTALVLLFAGGVLARLNRHAEPPVGRTSQPGLESASDMNRADPAAKQTSEMPATQTSQKPMAQDPPSNPPAAVSQPQEEKPAGSSLAGQKQPARGTPSSTPPVLPKPPMESTVDSGLKNPKLSIPDASPRSSPVVTAPRKKEPPVHSYPVVHDHVLGSCQGILKISEGALSFESDMEKHGFVLAHSEFTWSLDNDKLAVKKGDKTYRFKPAPGRSKDENRRQLEDMVQNILKFRPAAAPQK